MRRFITPIVVVLALLLTSSQVCAWSAAGHTVVGAIAYDVMVKERPKELAKVLAILRQHPQYDTVLKAKVESVQAENRDRYLLMIAARWPDDVRRAKGGYSHPTWHYVDLPIIPRGQSIKGEPPADINALTALDKQTKLLGAGWSVPGDKAIAVCWIAHLVGDLHQPLHCCSLYTDEMPKGDKGGNGTYVRVAANRATINLHKFWDDLLGTSAKYQDSANTATELRLRPSFGRDNLPELKKNATADSWAKESFDVAYKLAYVNATLKGGTEKDGTLLPDGYTKAAKEAAERRAILAGYRLADTLAAAVK